MERPADAADCHHPLDNPFRCLNLFGCFLRNGFDQFGQLVRDRFDMLQLFRGHANLSGLIDALGFQIGRKSGWREISINRQIMKPGTL